MASFKVVHFKTFEEFNVEHFITVSFTDVSNYF